MLTDQTLIQKEKEEKVCDRNDENERGRETERERERERGREGEREREIGGGREGELEARAPLGPSC